MIPSILITVLKSIKTGMALGMFSSGRNHPIGTDWSTNGVKVYTDPITIPAAPHPKNRMLTQRPTHPIPADGYETVIFNQGQGDDPDLAWVRIDPDNPNIVDFAFKQSLAGSSFMWGVWADAGLKNPGMFNYNERLRMPRPAHR